MIFGYDEPLYVLPFDHRGTFQTKLFGCTGELTDAQSAQITAMKQVIYDGFRAAIASGVPQHKAAILVDEQFGAGIMLDATAHGYTTALTAEKSGQDEFDFEYGDDFARHVATFRPTFCKVLVRYNPDGDAGVNGRQRSRLKRLSDYLHRYRTPEQDAGRLFMFELLVPPTPAQFGRVGGDKRAFDQTARPGLMVRAIRQLQNAGIEPDVWKIEGLESREDCESVVEAVQHGGRKRVGCIVLGRGEDDKKVQEWLYTAAAVPGFIGFAVGRTTFWDALTGWRAGRFTREQAVTAIARRYQEWVAIYEKARVPRPEPIATP